MQVVPQNGCPKVAPPNEQYQNARMCRPPYKFGVSGAKHCGKAALRLIGIKQALLTLAPVTACVKSSSGKLNHNLFTSTYTISVLWHRRCDPVKHNIFHLLV